jgi:tetratricopeptide (TPR) repeat protein
VPQPPEKRTVPHWVWLAGLTLLALLLRLLYVWQVGRLSLVTPQDLDPAFYYDWAKQIAAGHWLGTAPFVQSPLYAYLLGLLMKLVGSGVARILLVQALVGCGTVLLTYLAARLLLGPTQGLLAGLLLALYGPFIFYEGMVMKTFLSPFLTLALLLLLDRARDLSGPVPPSGRRGLLGSASMAFLGAGLVYGLLTLDRDNFILLAPILALLAAWLGGGATRRGMRAAALFTLGTMLLVAPVTLRNWVVSRDFVLLTTGGGEVFFIGNNADANGLYVPPPFVRPDPHYEHADFIARAGEIEGRPLTPMQSSWFWFRQGMQFVAGEPLAWLRLEGRKLLHFWNYYELPDNLDYDIMQRFSPLLARLNFTLPPPRWPTLRCPTPLGMVPVRLHLLSTFGTIAPLGLLGLYLTRRRWRRLLPLYLLLFGYMGTVLLFFNFSRFRVPVVPLLAILASEGLRAIGGYLAQAGRALLALASRSGDMVGRVKALRPGARQWVACAVLAVPLLAVNIELPRGVVPAIEQALITGNAYYTEGDPVQALQSYRIGLVLLGEGPTGARGEEILSRFGPDVSRERLLKELEVESIARGPQFKGIHIGIHHGIGIALVDQAQNLLKQGERTRAMALLDQAIAQFDEALKLAPSYLLSLRKMAKAYQLKGDTATALDWYRKAIDMWPDDLRTRLDVAELLFDTGDFKTALRHLEEARREGKNLDDAQLAEIYFNRGFIFLQGLKQPGRALYDFEKVLALNPGYPQGDQLRGTILRLRAAGYQPLRDEEIEAAAPPFSGS